MAGLIGTLTDAFEATVLPLLPVDPVYGGAGLRVLGGIEPRGLAVAGPLGEALHGLLPALFASSELTAAGAAVSALVGPGVTVLARVLTALLATALLLAIVGGASARLSRPFLRITAALTQVWLLLDLAHETDFGIRDIEATGLPFALAAFAPVDAQGQRVLLSTHLDALPNHVVAGLSAALAVGVCLLGAALLRAVVRCGRALATRRRTSEPSTELAARFRWRWPGLPLPSLPQIGSLVGVTAVALVLGVSPIGAIAEGEMVVLMAPHPVPDAQTPATDAPSPIVDEPSRVSTVAAEPAVLPITVEAATISAPSAVPTAAIAQASATAPTPATQPTSVPPATAIAASSEPPAPTGRSSGGSVVAVEGTGYQYTLRVDGQPTVVRGMGYNPWYASLPADERQQRYRRDFSAMQEIGVNTLEGWFQNQFDEVTLDEAQRHGLKVILPFELNQDYDYRDPAVKAMFRQQVTEWVLRYRDHPAVLMWGPGNEVMHRLIFPTAVKGQRDLAGEQRADDFAAFYVELVDMIRALDPNHPVVYRDAEDLYFTRLREALLRDGIRRPWFVYGTNVYTERLANVIERWPSQGLDAPLLVSEFSPGGSGTAERPNMLGWYWSTIRAHPKRVIGGVVYTWTTRGPEDLDRVFGLTDESGTPVDGSLGALRQLFRDDAATGRSPG
jgi:hypothetical protein